MGNETSVDGGLTENGNDDTTDGLRRDQQHQQHQRDPNASSYSSDQQFSEHRGHHERDGHGPQQSNNSATSRYDLRQQQETQLSETNGIREQQQQKQQQAVNNSPKVTAIADSMGKTFQKIKINPKNMPKNLSGMGRNVNQNVKMNMKNLTQNVDAVSGKLKGVTDGVKKRAQMVNDMAKQSKISSSLGRNEQRRSNGPSSRMDEEESSQRGGQRRRPQHHDAQPQQPHQHRTPGSNYKFRGGGKTPGQVDVNLVYVHPPSPDQARSAHQNERTNEAAAHSRHPRQKVAVPVNSSTAQPQRTAEAAPDDSDTNKWNQAWDRESEDSEDDSDEEEEPSYRLHDAAAAIGLGSHPFRLGMDCGHSGSPILEMRTPAVTPPSLNLPPNSPQNLSSREDADLRRQADHVLQEDGGVWDTAEDDGQVANEKPSVEMFFPLLRVLGKGSFGKVVLVRKQAGQETGGLFAMKILRKAHLVKRKQIERTKTERKVLAVADHPFIMKLHFAFQTEDKLFLVLDYCPGGELFFHLSRFRRFPERVAKFYTAELLLAIHHLHSLGIIYRDLKPENVLLDADGHVKLGDFGLAKDNISHACRGANSMCGTAEYMAPEVLSQSGHGFCVDYWALGMLVYEMMTGLPPWYTTDRAKLFQQLKEADLDIPTYFTDQSASFVSALLERDPRRRMGYKGVEDAMKHVFFRRLDWHALFHKRIEPPYRPCVDFQKSVNQLHSNGSDNDLDVSSQSNANDANRSVDGTRTPGDIAQGDLDNLTANFSDTFRRMALYTEDDGILNQDSGSAGSSEDFNAETFVGFTFDEENPSAVFPQATTRPQR